MITQKIVPYLQTYMPCFVERGSIEIDHLIKPLEQGGRNGRTQKKRYEQKNAGLDRDDFLTPASVELCL